LTSDGVAGGTALTEGKWAGWSAWSDPQPDTFLQAIGQGYMRVEGPGKALVALETRAGHRNRNNTLHGGFLAAFADHVYFGALWVLGHRSHVNGVTLDLTMQYLGAGKIGPDLLAEAEVLRETGRFFFVRLLITQEGQAVASSTATLRKASMPK